MSKEDIVNKLKEKCSSANIEITKADLSEIHDMFMTIINDDLNKKGEIRLHGICTLKIVETKERQCRNPRDGKVMTVPKKKRVKFIASQTLKDNLNPELKKVKEKAN